VIRIPPLRATHQLGRDHPLDDPGCARGADQAIGEDGVERPVERGLRTEKGVEAALQYPGGRHPGGEQPEGCEEEAVAGTRNGMSRHFASCPPVHRAAPRLSPAPSVTPAAPAPARSSRSPTLGGALAIMRGYGRSGRHRHGRRGLPDVMTAASDAHSKTAQNSGRGGGTGCVLSLRCVKARRRGRTHPRSAKCRRPAP